jgi:hypothetical protein
MLLCVGCGFFSALLCSSSLLWFALLLALSDPFHAQLTCFVCMNALMIWKWAFVWPLVHGIQHTHRSASIAVSRLAQIVSLCVHALFLYNVVMYFTWCSRTSRVLCAAAVFVELVCDLVIFKRIN